MKLFAPRIATALVFSSLLLLPVVSSAAEDKIQGTITVGTQAVTFSHGLAWINTKGRVYVGFFSAALNAKEVERALKGEGANFGVFEVPNVVLDLSFKEGGTQADLVSLSGCHVGFYDFPRHDSEMGMWDYNTGTAKDCGALALSGDLKPGAVVHGKLKGQAVPMAFPGDKPRATYSWDVEFTATLRAKP